MLHLKKIVSLIAIFLTLGLLNPISVDAQCPMCRMSAESNLKNGGTAGKGLNKGILYLFFTPYLVVGTLAYIWWKNNKARKAEEAQDTGM
jgi:hypothetical protein